MDSEPPRCSLASPSNRWRTRSTDVTVSERQRLELYERLGDTLGKEHAEVLMEYLPPVGWSDVARHRDIVELRGEMASLRGDLRTEIAELRAEMHDGLRRQTHWVIGAIGLATAITTSVAGAIAGLS
jgi:hypothetical protein